MARTKSKGSAKENPTTPAEKEQEIRRKHHGEGRESHSLAFSFLESAGKLDSLGADPPAVLVHRSVPFPEFSGSNTFVAVSNLIKVIDKVRRNSGHKSLEYQIFLNDLPTNDFNTIFKSTPDFQQKLTTGIGYGFGPLFITGVPGSFYHWLFPTKSLHFVHSSYSLHWLSQVPEPAGVKKGNIYLASSSPPSVVKAYFKQFEKDFSAFQSCRAEELVTCGRMDLTILGRKSEDPCGKDGFYIWKLSCGP